MGNLYLPPGSGEIPEDMQRKLQHGHPETGWLGHPNMAIIKCNGVQCGKRPCHGRGWRVVENREDGRDYVVCHNPNPQMNDKLFRRLAEGDPRTLNVDKMLAEVDAHNDKIEADLARENEERFAEGAERLAKELYK